MCCRKKGPKRVILSRSTLNSSTLYSMGLITRKMPLGLHCMSLRGRDQRATGSCDPRAKQQTFHLAQPVSGHTLLGSWQVSRGHPRAMPNLWSEHCHNVPIIAHINLSRIFSSNQLTPLILLYQIIVQRHCRDSCDLPHIWIMIWISFQDVKNRDVPLHI